MISLFGFPPGRSELPGPFHWVDGIAHCISEDCGAAPRAAGRAVRAGLGDRLGGEGQRVPARSSSELPFRELPVLTFDGRAVFGSAHWKLDAIDEYAAGRPAAWIDDNLDDECRAWADGARGADAADPDRVPDRDARRARGRAAGLGGCHHARMVHLNLADLEFEYDDTDPEGFRSGRVKVARGTRAADRHERVGAAARPGDVPVPLRDRRGGVAAGARRRAHAADPRGRAAAGAAGARLLPHRPRRSARGPQRDRRRPCGR